MSVASQPAAEIRPASWFRRNWKWFLPGLFVVAVVLGAVAIFGYVQVRSNGYRQNPAYQLALDVVQSSEEVQERLGAPVEDSDWNPQGAIELRNNGDVGEARFNFSVSGPEGQADVITKGRMVDHEWAVTDLDVLFPDGDRVSLTEQIQAKQKVDTPAFNPQAAQKQSEKQAGPPETPVPDVNVQVPDVPPGIK